MENSGGIQGNITAGLAGRYAVALFDLARESNAIDAVAKSLATLKTGLADSADLSALIASPVVSRTDAANAIAAVAKALKLDSLTAKVTSAHPLTAAQLKELTANLKSRVGRDVTVATTVDPAILGGLVVQLGSQLIDGSIRTRLNSFAQAMKG